jgi:ParB family chromosome partitioning protein
MGKTALDGAKRGTTFEVDPMVPQIIGFDTHHRNRDEHPLWQERALDPVDEAFAHHIAKKGFNSVIVCRKDGETLEVIYGRGRVKAARMANEIRAEKGEPPVKVVLRLERCTSNAELVGMVIAENALRRQVAPMTMARDLHAMMKFGASTEEAANVLGKSVATVKGFLRLLDLDPVAQDAVQNRKLLMSHAVALADLSREQQLKELDRLLSSDQKVTTAVVRANVKARRNGKERAVIAPSKGTLRRLVKHEDGEVIFGAEGIKALKWAIGECDERQFRGLAETIRALRE